MFGPRPLGLKDLLGGALPLTLSVDPGAAELTTSATGWPPIAPYPIAPGAGDGLVSSVVPGTLAQAGLTRSVLTVETRQPIPAGTDGFIDLRAEVFAAAGASLGFDIITVDVDLVPPVLSTGESSVVDDDLRDGVIDRLCVAANEPLDAVEIEVNGATLTLATADASTVASLPAGGIRYCFDDVPVPGAGGTSGGPYDIGITGYDAAGNASGAITLTVSCRVPATNVIASVRPRGQRLLVDGDGTPHVLVVAETDQQSLVEIVERGGSWAETTRFDLPAGKTLAGRFDALIAADDSIHVCLPLRSSDSADPTGGRPLLYLARSSAGVAWLTESVVSGEAAPFDCAIALDRSAPTSPPEPELYFAYQSMEAPRAATVARVFRKDAATVPCFQGDPATCATRFEAAWDQCLLDIDVVVHPDRTVHLVGRLCSPLAYLVYLRRAAEPGVWQAGLARGDHPTLDWGGLMAVRTPSIALRGNEVHIFTQVYENPNDWFPLIDGTFRPAAIWHIWRPIGAPVGFPFVDFAAIPITAPVHPTERLHAFAPLDHRQTGLRVDVAATAAGWFRVGYGRAAQSGLNGELTVVYEEHCCDAANETIVASTLDTRGDYALAVNAADRVRAVYFSGDADGDKPLKGPDEINYYQEENEVEQRRSAALGGSTSCAREAFAALCASLDEADVRLVPEPLVLPAVDTVEGLEEARTRLQLVFPMTLRDSEARAAAVFLKPFLDRLHPVDPMNPLIVLPINAANWDNGPDDIVVSGRDDGSVSLLEDIFRGIIVQEGRFLLKRQHHVCVPDSMDLPAGNDVCDADSGGTVSMDLSPVRDIDPVEREFAASTPPVTSLIIDPAGLDACLAAGGLVVLRTPSALMCVTCAEGVYAPQLDSCVTCGPGTVVHQDIPGRPFVNLATDRAVCLGCPDDQLTLPQARRVHHLQEELKKCTMCPDGTAAKACSSNVTCLDPVSGRTDYACGASGLCERIRPCATDDECAGGFCQSRSHGRCVVRQTCTRDDECGARNSCVDGACQERFDETEFETVDGDVLCDPIGCVECWQNQYCFGPADCPEGHHCSVDADIASPACLLRPVLNDPALKALRDLPAFQAIGGSVDEILDPIEEILHDEPVPLTITQAQSEGEFTLDSLDIEVVRAEVSIRSDVSAGAVTRSTAGAQGVIQVAVFFRGDRVSAAGTGRNGVPGCRSADIDAHTSGPAIFRMFFQPYVDVGATDHRLARSRVRFVYLGADMVKGLVTEEEAEFDIDGVGCTGGCKESCADFDTQEKREQVRRNLVGQLAERFSQRLLDSVDALYENLVFNEAFGFLLFNYQPSCTDVPGVDSVELVRVRDGQVQTVCRRAASRPAPEESCQLPAEVVPQCAP